MTILEIINHSKDYQERVLSLVSAISSEDPELGKCYAIAAKDIEKGGNYKTSEKHIEYAKRNKKKNYALDLLIQSLDQQLRGYEIFLAREMKE